MFRGSTPLHIFDVNMDLREAAAIYITYQQNNTTILEVDQDRLEVSQTSLRFRLSQEETLRFGRGQVSIQIRYVMPDGTAGVSCLVHVLVQEILKDGEI